MPEFSERVAYYGTKCRQHLSRVRLSHELALGAAGSERTRSDQSVDDLIRASFGDKMPASVEMKVFEVLYKVHLMSLKANFDLFLNRLLSTVWTFHFTDLAPTIAVEKPLSLRELATSITESNADARAFVIEKIVPKYGLQRFEPVLQRATHIRLRDVLKRKDLRCWPQIYTAFEIRNLMEHRDGHVDKAFRTHLVQSWDHSTLWVHSSWGRENLEQLKKVFVEEEDVDRTYTAMLDATDLLTEAVLQWRPVSVQGQAAT